MDFTTKFGFPKPILGEQGAGKAQEFADAMESADTSLANHDHTAGAGAQISHASLSDIGTNTHAQIDGHLSATDNPHGVSAAQTRALADGADTVQETHIDWGTGPGQVSADHIPDGGTKIIPTAA